MRYIGHIQIAYANVACPRCGEPVTRPCRSVTGYNYDFRYTHAARRRLWWSLYGPTL